MKHIVSLLGAAVLIFGCSRKEPNVTPAQPTPTPEVESVQHATPVVGKPGFVLGPSQDGTSEESCEESKNSIQI